MCALVTGVQTCALPISLTAAELGHLVISTMRASSAAHSVQRLIELFPPIDQGQVRHALGSALRGIVNQRLLERADGRGRIPAVEVLVGTGKVAETIADTAHPQPLDHARTEAHRDGNGDIVTVRTR